MTSKARVLRDDSYGMTKSALAIAVVAILVLSGVIYFGYSQWFEEDESEEEERFIVEEGDTVTCDYIGAFTDKRVFDTSLLSVAHNNITYPKSLQFELRPSHGYTPYEFTVGSSDTIEGWQDAVKGMTIGQTKVVTIPVEKAYGFADETKIVRENITFSVGMFVEVNLDVFEEKYSGVPTAPGALFNHLDLKWPCEVYTVDETSRLLTYRNRPDLYEVYTIYEDSNWRIKVTDMDQTGEDGYILCQHVLDESDEGAVLVTEKADGSQFIVTEVNMDEGYFVKDYNREVVGKPLVFSITIKSITKATA